MIEDWVVIPLCSMFLLIILIMNLDDLRSHKDSEKRLLAVKMDFSKSNELMRKEIDKIHSENTNLKRFVQNRVKAIKEYCGNYDACDCEDCTESCPESVDQMDCLISDEYKEGLKLLGVEKEK